VCVYVCVCVLHERGILYRTHTHITYTQYQHAYHHTSLFKTSHTHQTHTSHITHTHTSSHTHTHHTHIHTHKTGPEEKEKLASHPMYRLEYQQIEKEKARARIPRFLKLKSVADRMKNDYDVSRVMRRIFRVCVCVCVCVWIVCVLCMLLFIICYCYCY